MKMRNSARGSFWSCSKYPACRGTVDAGGQSKEKKPMAAPPLIGVPPGARPVEDAMPNWQQLDEYQRYVAGTHVGRMVVAAAAGCHPAGTRIMLASGKCVAVETVRPGTQLMGPDGAPRRVQRLIRGTGSIMRVHPVKGAPFAVNDQHVLTLVGSSYKSINGKIIDVRVCDLTDKVLSCYKLFRVGVDTFQGGAASSDLPIDPYILGVLIGDGSLGSRRRGVGLSVSVAKPDLEIAGALREFADTIGMQIKQDKITAAHTCPVWRLSMADDVKLGRYQKAPIRLMLERVGLYAVSSGDRWVPSQYLYADAATRRELLAGLLDTDGHYERGGYDYISKSKQLAEDVCFVARSLGLAAYLTPCRKRCQNNFVGDYFRVSISGDCTILPLRIPRKQAQPRKQIKSVLRTGIAKIEPLGEDAFYGFTLDGDGRYLLSDFTVTHNSGKSHCLVERSVWLMHGGAVPESVLLLAYNKDAAETLRERLSGRLGRDAGRIAVFTFHAWAYAVLRHWYPGDERYRFDRILGGAEGMHPIRIAAPLVELHKLDLSPWTLLAAADRIAENMVQLGVLDTPQQIAHAMGWTPREEKSGVETLRQAETYAKFCVAWRDAKARENVIDFTDMLCSVAWAILQTPEAPHVAWLRGAYQHVMVDEAQDGNPARNTIARYLGSQAKSLLYCGDLRQSLYSFTGARPDQFLALSEEEGTIFTTLPYNRRSTKNIVEAANEIARGHEWNLGGDCFPLADKPLGEPVDVRVQDSPQKESTEIIEDINTRIRRGLPLGTPQRANYAVLARTNAMLVDLECAFVAKGVPVRVVGNPGGVWASSIGKEMIAYLEGIEGIPTWALLNVANKPKRYCKKDDLRAVIEGAQARERAGQPASFHNELCMHKAQGMQRFGYDLRARSREPWPVKVLAVARWLGLEAPQEIEGGDQDRADAIRSLMMAAQSMGSIKAIYDHRNEAAKGERVPAVELSTIHRMKGEERTVIYVAGVRTDKLPHKLCESEAEEWRVLYVAVTRAQEVCVITTGGRPSKFLRELGWVEDDEEPWDESGGKPSIYGLGLGLTGTQTRVSGADYEGGE